MAGMVGDSVIEYWLKLTKKNEKQKYRILYYYSKYYMKCKCLLLIDFITLSPTVPVTYVKTESHKIVLIVPYIIN